MDLSKFNIQELALLNAWSNQSNGTNWFFYADDSEDTHVSDKDSIESVANAAHRGFVKLVKLGIGYVVELAPKVLTAVGYKSKELDEFSVLEGIVNQLKSDNSLGTFIIGWSTNHDKYMRGDDEISRYCGSLSRHKSILTDAGYTFYPSDCALMESGDGVLVPILKISPEESDLSGYDIDMETVISNLKDAYEESDEEEIAL